MERMNRGWGRQPGHGQAGSRAPSQPRQEALREHISLSLGTRESALWAAPDFLPGVWWEETLGASPGLPKDLRWGKVHWESPAMFHLASLASSSSSKPPI